MKISFDFDVSSLGDEDTKATTEAKVKPVFRDASKLSEAFLEAAQKYREVNPNMDPSSIVFALMSALSITTGVLSTARGSRESQEKFVETIIDATSQAIRKSREKALKKDLLQTGTGDKGGENES